MPWICGRGARKLLRHKVVRSKVLVLTFDDGPSEKLTCEVLDILKRRNVKATFFLLGKNVACRKHIVRQIAVEGHDIGSHGYSHLNYWKVSPFRAIVDIKQGWAAINTALDTENAMYPFRPPYGKLNLFCMIYLALKRVPVVYWTLVSGDTWPADKRDSKRAALFTRNAGGAVILAHDFNEHTNPDIEAMTLESLCLSLDMSQEVGMKTQTVSQLLAKDRRSKHLSAEG